MVRIKTLGSRIEELIEILGCKKSEFADKIGITPAYVSQICAGVRQPSDRVIKDICREYNVNYLWLTGEDESVGMLSEATTIDGRFSAVMSGENEFAKDVMRRFLALDDKDWKDLQRVIEKLKRAGE